MSNVAVIGGGICGSAAALELVKAGHRVTLLERSPNLGGLVVSFTIGGTPLECFYHHIFPHEHHVISLINELGLSDRLEWHPSTVAVFTRGKVWPFTSPLDLLRFSPLPLVDRVRTGIGALRLGRVKDWEQLDGVSARDWLAAYTGARARDVVWDPLLGAKFGPAAADVPAAWMWGRFQQRAGARENGGERLGYLRGGFRQMFDALHADLVRRGVDVRCNTGVTAIDVRDGRAQGVTLSDGSSLPSDAVIFAGTLPSLPALMPAEHVDSRWAAAQGLGVLVVVLELDRPMSDTYWINVCDTELPFGGVIEHTNLLPTSDYGGRHVVYLSRYFTADEAVASAVPAEEAAVWVERLAERWPGFDPSSVLAVHPFRAPYAAPLVGVGYRATIPPVRSHIDGLYLSTTAQIYPQDRGMSEGVRTGADVAQLVSADIAAGAGAR
jgi:protoporphyrinogen oxidase